MPSKLQNDSWMWQFWESPSRLPQVRKKTGWVQGLVSWMAREMAATSGRIIAFTWDQGWLEEEHCTEARYTHIVNTKTWSLGLVLNDHHIKIATPDK